MLQAEGGWIKGRWIQFSHLLTADMSLPQSRNTQANLAKRLDYRQGKLGSGRWWEEQRRGNAKTRELNYRFSHHHGFGAQAEGLEIPGQNQLQNWLESGKLLGRACTNVFRTIFNSFFVSESGASSG